MQRESGCRDAEGDGDERSLAVADREQERQSLLALAARQDTCCREVPARSLTTLSSLEASTPQRHLLRAQLVQIFTCIDLERLPF